MVNDVKKSDNKSRYDLELITDLVDKNSKVLDIGCGDGKLLNLLVNKRDCDARGIEISSHQVSKALMKGLSVIQGDAESDLEHYPDKTFDYAILSHTIQATKEPNKIVQEMLRIADKAIVSLPNFANYKNRFHLFFKGTMPVNESIPYEWYETPNIHFCSIQDFRNLCHDMDIEVLQEKYLVSGRTIKSGFIVNLFADYGIFLIQSSDYAANTEALMVNGKGPQAKNLSNPQPA